LDHEPHRQIDHAVGILTARWGQIRQGSLEVLMTFRTIVLRIGDDEIPWTPAVEISQVVQRPLKLLVPRGGVTTAWAGLPLVIATRGNDLWWWQVCNRGHPFGGIGSIRPRTEPSCVLLACIVVPALYDTCPTGAIPKPGKDAIVSMFLDVPRWDNLHNMKRIALCWSELVSRGLPTSLHLNARTDRDWERWIEFIGA